MYVGWKKWRREKERKRNEKQTRKDESIRKHFRFLSLNARDAKGIDQNRANRSSRFIRLEIRGSNRAVVLSFTKISLSKCSLTCDDIYSLLIFVYPLKQNNFFFLDWTKRFASVYQICVKNWLFEPVIKIYKIRFVDLSELPIHVKYTVYVYCIPAENFVEIDRRCCELQTVKNGKNGQFLTNFGLSLFTVSSMFRNDFDEIFIMYTDNWYSYINLRNIFLKYSWQAQTRKL